MARVVGILELRDDEVKSSKTHVAFAAAPNTVFSITIVHIFQIEVQ